MHACHLLLTRAPWRKLSHNTALWAIIHPQWATGRQPWPCAVHCLLAQPPMVARPVKQAWQGKQEGSGAAGRIPAFLAPYGPHPHPHSPPRLPWAWPIVTAWRICHPATFLMLVHTHHKPSFLPPFGAPAGIQEGSWHDPSVSKLGPGLGPCCRLPLPGDTLSMGGTQVGQPSAGDDMLPVRWHTPCRVPSSWHARSGAGREHRADARQVRMRQGSTSPSRVLPTRQPQGVLRSALFGKSLRAGGGFQVLL